MLINDFWHVVDRYSVTIGEKFDICAVSIETAPLHTTAEQIKWC